MVDANSISGAGTHNFRVDLGGVIALLSKNLYSGPGVYVRELIQNAMDAIVAREHPDGSAGSRAILISPYGVESPGSPVTEFTITDPGIGLRPDQVEEVLATVGASTKREQLSGARRNFIGQFGIGLLSCFMVADRITVTSRSATGAERIEWVGNNDGTYRVTTPAHEVPVGTTVRLRPRPEMIGWVRPEQVLPLARKYAEFLPAEITVWDANGPQHITRPYPWRDDFEAHRYRVQQGVSPHYGGLGVGKQFDAIEVDLPDLGLNAVVYIGSLRAKRRAPGRDRVYVNDMLVDDSASMLPEWAFFAWTVVTSTRLEPTAGRESLMDTKALDRTRAALGRAALGWLQNLADTDPQRFAEFVSDHEFELRRTTTSGSGPEKLELAEVVLPMLTMHTTEGDLRLIDVIQRNPNLLYAVTVDEFRTIAGFNPGGRIVINAGHTLDQEILLTLPQVLPGVTATRVYPANEVIALREPTRDDHTRSLALARRATTTLTKQRCTVAVRQFPSPDLPAVFIGHGRVDSASPGYAERSNLVLNWGNRVVRALLRTDDEVVFDRVVQLLFVQARMAARADGPQDRAMLSAALDDIMVLAIGMDGTEIP